MAKTKANLLFDSEFDPENDDEFYCLDGDTILQYRRILQTGQHLTFQLVGKTQAEPEDYVIYRYSN